jgi:tRNA(Ile)-lysidine synthetase-like protein
MNAASGGRRITFDHVACAIRLIEAEEGDGKALDLPGHRLHRIGGQIVLTGGKGSQGSRGARGSANHANLFRIPLSTPGEVVIPGTGDLVSVEHAGDVRASAAGATGASGGASGVFGQERCATTGNGLVARVRHDLVRGSLAVRNRRAGDRFRPVGLGGSKKLQDFFVDRKVGRRERDSVPIVVDETDHVIWVAGHGMDEAFQVTDASQAVLVLRLTRAGQARWKHAEDLS